MGKSAKKLWMISIALAMFIATVATAITMSASSTGGTSGSPSPTVGRWGPYSVSAGTSKYFRVSFPTPAPDVPVISWTNEVYPFSAKAHYAIDRGYIPTTYFDARITAVDALTNNYINWIGFVPGGSSEESLKTQTKEDRGAWHVYVYRASSGKNGESARMGVIPYLRELGYDGGINVGSSWEGQGSYIVIGLPFKLSEEQLSVINETLEDFGYELVDTRVDK